MASSEEQTNINSERESNPGKSPSDDQSSSQEGLFECNICLDTARDAVISLCGHLFCWPCLHQWLETRPNKQVCPVCKAGISKDKVIPLYGRGNTKQQDPRDKLPPRPPGQRPEPDNNGPFQGFGFGDGGFHMSFGIGAFPFGIFASAFNFSGGRPAPGGDARFLDTYVDDDMFENDSSSDIENYTDDDSTDVDSSDCSDSESTDSSVSESEDSNESTGTDD